MFFVFFALWMLSRNLFHSVIYIVKLLDWGEEGIKSESELAQIRVSFQQEVAVWHKLFSRFECVCMLLW